MCMKYTILTDINECYSNSSDGAHSCEQCAITPKDHITVYVLLVTNSGMTVSHVKVRLSIVAHACAFIFSYIHANL